MRRLPGILLLGSVAAIGPSTVLAGNRSCVDSPGAYQTAGYRVRTVRIRAPWAGFRRLSSAALAAWQREQTSVTDGGLAVASLPETRGRFDAEAWSLGALAIQNHLSASSVNNRFEGALVTAGLENCDEREKQLDVTYTAFAMQIPAAVPLGREDPVEMVARALRSPFSRGAWAGLAVQPRISWDPARGLLTGAEAAFQAKPGGRWPSAAVRALGSPAAVEAAAQLHGSRSRDQAWWRDHEWGLLFSFLERPAQRRAATAGFSQSRVAVRFAASSRPLAGGRALLRWGGALSGGHDQGRNREPGWANTPLTAVQLYAGLLIHAGPYSGQLSYGYQQSQPGAPTGGFSKQLLDSRQEFRFLPRPHHPLAVQFDVGAGRLPSQRTLPAAEGFFGGNLTRPFIPGDSWELRADPYLRSLPALHLRAGPGWTGAVRFFSVNTTVAATIWSRPLLPDALRQDPVFAQGLYGQIRSAATLWENSFLREDRDFARLQATLVPVAALVAETRAALETTAAESAAPGALTAALDALEETEAALAAAQEAPAGQSSPTAPYRALALGFGQPRAAHLTTLARELQAAAADHPSQSLHLTQLAGRARAIQETMGAALGRAESRAQARARRDLAFLGRFLGRLEREVNLAALSPLLLFDVVQAGDGRGVGRWYIGAGPGVRLTIVHVNFDLGYAAHATWRPGEPRGALYLRLSLADLLR